MHLSEHKRAESLRTRCRIYDFFRNNPCHTNSDCAKALGLNPGTVGRHAKAIRAGWRPENKGAK